jgi:hypothetical protein
VEEAEVMIETGRTVRGTVRKQVSDGNYGTEAVEITIEWPVEDGQDEDTVAENLLQQARRLVHLELSHSPSANVRRAVAMHDHPTVAGAGSQDDPFRWQA